MEAKKSFLFIRGCRRLLKFLIWILLGLVSTLFFAVGGMFPLTAQSSPPLSVVQTFTDTAQQEQRGREYYEAEQFSEAVKIWQQVLRSYQLSQDELNQARVLSNLSLAYQQLGQWSQATQAMTESLKFLRAKRSHSSPEHLKVLAQVFNTQGNLELATGKPEAAFSSWKQATEIYTRIKNETGAIRSLINQSQALRALGLYRRALSTLTQVQEIIQKQPDSLLKAAGLRSLGISLRLVGKLEQAQQVLQQSLAIAQKLQSPQEISAVLIDLGNVARTNKNDQSVLDFYQQAIALAPSQTLKIRAQLNQLSILIETKQWALAQVLGSQILSQLANLPPSRTAIYAQMNLVESLTHLQQANVPDAPMIATIAQLVATSYQQAKTLGDQQAEAYTLGKLGRLYEQTHQWSIAQDVTQQALVLAQAINMPEITYRLEWQLGRLLKVRGDVQGAIAIYTQAVNTLQSLRRDLVGIDQDIQFSFRESVEPFYRELVGLLLQRGTSKPSQESLIKARQIIESLQLAELDNFFREACLDTRTTTTQIEQFDTQAAIIYPIILEDRLEVILSLPRQPLHQYTTPLPQSQLENIAEKLRRNLVIRTKNTFKPLSQQVYEWLIRPAETDLANSKVKTLVFVLDGVLRNIPMAALHDGHQYLIEKYSIALTPSLQLLPPKQLQPGKFKVLSAGLTEARQGFSPLEYVGIELKAIKSEVPSVVLLNQDFTRDNLQTKIQSDFFPIVHIATHGKFSSKEIETFILTWNDRIHINDLDNLLQIPEHKKQQAIELLVLSACETATGDKRAALGLAGIAVKAGARSTLATLWSVNDGATAEMMGQFYKELTNPKQTKAEALRNSQLTLLKDPQYEHPIYWAPYILVGNWL